MHVFVESLGHDIRYACRSFLRTPGIAITAILAIALGVGACTADSALLIASFRALPYAQEEWLVSVVSRPR
jgi:hypothetical protein